jgi:hypothetical protein
VGLWPLAPEVERSRPLIVSVALADYDNCRSYQVDVIL